MHSGDVGPRINDALQSLADATEVSSATEVLKDGVAANIAEIYSFYQKTEEVARASRP